jgi:SHO1 osmosensor
MPNSSLGSPSLQKMDANRREMYGGRKSRFSCGQIVGDPFALATSSIAIVRRHDILAFFPSDLVH